MRLIAAFLLSAGLSAPLFSQEKPARTVQLGSEEAYWEGERGRVYIYTLDAVGRETREGMTPIKIGNLWGFMNAQKRIVVFPEYLNFNSFHSGVAPVKMDDKWGLINKTGERVLPAELDEAPALSKSLEIFEAKKGGKTGYFNALEKRWVINPGQYETVKSFDEKGLAIVCQNGKWGCLDKKGEIIVPLEFEDYPDFESANGWFRVKKGGLYGYYDAQTKKMAIEPQFQSVTLSNGVLWVRKNSLYGSITPKGEEIFPPLFDEIITPSETKKKVIRVHSNGKPGYYHLEDKKWVVDPHRYDWIVPVENGYLAAQKGKKWGLVDSKGEEILPVLFDQAPNIGLAEDRLLKVTIDGKYGFWDLDAKKMAVPAQYSDVDSFRNDLARFSKESARVPNSYFYGFLNKEGLEVVPAKYEAALPFHANVTFVRLGGKWGAIDKTGKEIVPLQHEAPDAIRNNHPSFKSHDKEKNLTRIWSYDETGKLLEMKTEKGIK